MFNDVRTVGTNSLATVRGTSSQAEVRFVSGQLPSITANVPVNTVAASPPSVAGIMRQANGVMSLTATGSPGVPYRLWSSPNLATGTWTVVESGTLTTSPFVIQDPGAAGKPARFYRFSTP